MLALLQPNEVQTVHLTMPRFDVDTATALLDVLSATGVRSPFVAGTGDFDPMTADAVVWIDRVAHQATVTVDEQGTEAAAATAVMGVAASVRRPVEPVTVVVDRPFYFAITTTDDLLPLFLGRVTGPDHEVALRARAGRPCGSPRRTPTTARRYRDSASRSLGFGTSACHGTRCG